MGWSVGMVGLQDQFANRGGKGGGNESSDEEDDDFGLSPVKELNFGKGSSAAQVRNTKDNGTNSSTTQPQVASEWENLPKPQPPPKYHQNVYHLCRKADWEEACNSKTPYFPRTFLRDGKYTRASKHLDDVAHVANQYYWKTSPLQEEWIVLEIDVQFLFHGLGIPMEVAIAPESPKHLPIECLHIFGGISSHPKIVGTLIKSVYKMKRRDVDGKFVGMLYSVLSEKGKDSEPQSGKGQIKGILKNSNIPPKRRSADKLYVKTNSYDDEDEDEDEEYPIDNGDLEETTSEESNEMKVVDKAINNIDKAIAANNYESNKKKKKKFKMLFSKIKGRKSWSP